MTTPVRLRLQRGLTSALQEITPAAGYTYDLTGRVYRGRYSFDADNPFAGSDKVPLVTILEPMVPPQQYSQSYRANTAAGAWELMIQGFVEVTDENFPTDDAHMLMADVKRRLASEKDKLNLRPAQPLFGVHGVTDTQIGTGVCRPGERGSPHAFFYMMVTFNVTEDLKNP